MDLSRTVSRFTWDKGGAVTGAIRDGFGSPAVVAAKLGLTEAEFWKKHSMFRKTIEEAMRKEREAVMKVWAAAVDAAVLEWIVEATGGTRVSDQRLFDAIRGHVLFVLRAGKGV